jgi:hypothetical protein
LSLVAMLGLSGLAGATAGRVASPPPAEGCCVVVDSEPLSEDELAVQPAGETPPGASSASASTEAGQRRPAGVLPVLYRNATYDFSLRHPARLAVRSRPAAALAALEPKPLAAYAVSRSAATDPPDLELRVHRKGQASSLESWLSSRGLVDEGTKPPKPFRTGNVSGLEVCKATMLAPGCSYFVLGSHWVYQLTPNSRDGEQVAQTFRIVGEGAANVVAALAAWAVQALRLIW